MVDFTLVFFCRSYFYLALPQVPRTSFPLGSMSGLDISLKLTARSYRLEALCCRANPSVDRSGTATLFLLTSSVLRNVRRE